MKQILLYYLINFIHLTLNFMNKLFRKIGNKIQQI